MTTPNLSEADLAALEAAHQRLERCQDPSCWQCEHDEQVIIDAAPALFQATRERDSMQRVCTEIQSIMVTYRKQESESGYVDTPGGLEHMGDVWKLLSDWDEDLRRAARLLLPRGRRAMSISDERVEQAAKAITLKSGHACAAMFEKCLSIDPGGCPCREAARAALEADAPALVEAGIAGLEEAKTIALVTDFSPRIQDAIDARISALRQSIDSPEAKAT